MKISVWSDYACPFCWIGEARLRKAIAELGLEDETSFNPRAFELNPEAPETTAVNGLTTIANRYHMPLEQAAAQFEQIAALGRAEGLTLNQTDTHHTNTFNAHRLMKLGLAEHDRTIADKLNELLFEAFFVDNLNLADKKVLLEIGVKAGLKEEKIRALLDSDEFAAAVRADETEAARLGIHAVPYFMFENGSVARGAVSIEELKNILRNAAKRGSGQRCGLDGCPLN